MTEKKLIALAVNIILFAAMVIYICFLSDGWPDLFLVLFIKGTEDHSVHKYYTLAQGGFEYNTLSVKLIGDFHLGEEPGIFPLFTPFCAGLHKHSGTCLRLIERKTLTGHKPRKRNV